VSARLVTIGPSHYCEKARWALDRAGVPYRESVHLPLLHWAASLPLGSRTVPILITEGTKLTESNDILAFADARATEERRILPRDRGAREEVDRLVARFDRELGPLTRRLAYCLLVPRPELFLKVFEGTASPAQRRLLRHGHGLLRGAMKRAFKTSPRVEARTIEKLAALFDDVGAALGDRGFLVGDGFTAADLTFAALSTPILLPPELPGCIARSELPADMAPTVDRFRETRAGRHALAMYASHRRPRLTPG